MESARSGTGPPRAGRLARLLALSRSPGVNVAQTVLTAGAFVLLRRAHLLARTPVWVYLVLLAVGMTLAAITSRRWGADCTDRQLHARTAVSVALTTAVIYATGWGPTLAIGYMFLVTDGLRQNGSRAARPTMIWSLVGIGAGQVAIASHLAPTLVKAPAVHGLAVLAALGLGFAIQTVGATTAEKERAQAEVRRSEERFRSLVQNASDVVAVVSADGKLTYISPAVHRMVGYRPEEFLSGSNFVHPDDVPNARVIFRNVLDHPRTVFGGELRVRHADGTWRWQEVNLTNLLDDPSVEGIVANFHDVTDRKRFEEELQHAAFHDRLTQLANRAGFTERLSQALARAQRHRLTTAVLFLDLDRLKIINDTLGHNVGDQVLAEVAARLRACVREEDTIARFGGDEFTILLEDIRAADAAATADRIVKSLRRPIGAGGRELTVSASLGVVVSGEGGALAEELLRNADLAMYLAKEKGRSRWELFDAEMGSGILERYRIEADLHRAVGDGSLVVYFQPEVCLATTEIVGFEAVVRWQHPERGLLLPGEFITVAEESDLIVEVDHYVLGQACAYLRTWQEELGDDLPLSMSVNVSPRSLSPEAVAGLAQIVAQSGVDPRRLQFEITERAAVDQSPSARSALTALRELGVRLAIDDFGTGYSSLAFLERCPVDVVKLDRGFVADLTTSATAVAIVRAIIALVHELGLRITAEGTETGQQVELLRAFGCDTAQGHYFAAPLSPDGARALLNAGLLALAHSAPAAVAAS